MKDMATLTTAWQRAAERTLLPNSRLLQEFERIRQVVRLQPARATAGLDMEAMRWSAYKGLRARRFAGLELKA